MPYPGRYSDLMRFRLDHPDQDRNCHRPGRTNFASVARVLVPLIVGLSGLACAQSPPPKTEPSSRTLEYTHDGQTLEGVFAWNPSLTGPRPAVLIAHEGPGSSPIAKARAIQFAKLGYVALAADLFGKGTAPKDRADAARRLQDRQATAQRLEAGLALLAKQPQVQRHRTAGVGYGLGATALLDLARNQADLVGVVGLHGDWSAPKRESGKISSRVLVLMGTDDRHATLEKFGAFEAEMKAANADWDAIRFGGVAGDFTTMQAGQNPATGFAFDADADQRAHAAVRQFLTELFGQAPIRSFAPVGEPGNSQAKLKLPVGVPDKAIKVLQHVDDHDRAMDGYEGGRHFGNFEGRLPSADRNGRRIRYREWDVNPLRPGVNRGPERLVTGSDGSAYFTDDHYSTFKKIR